MKFQILCGNKSSFQIALDNGRVTEEFGKPAILVRCNRSDIEDNQRGLSLAVKLCDFLNDLPEAERVALLAEEMIPANAE